MPKHALVIGVGPSMIASRALKSAVADAERVRDFLLGDDDRVQLPPQESWSVTPLIASDRRDPFTGTSQHLYGTFRQWLTSTKPLVQDDLHLLLYFAGHAQPRGSGEVELLGTDRGWLTLSELAEFMAESPARNFTVILDCCHAGALKDQFARQLVGGASRRGRAVFAACSTHQEALSYSDLAGLFTTVVLDGLGIDSQGVLRERITAVALAEYIKANWSRRVTSDVKALQDPDVMFNIPDGKDIPIIEVRKRPAPVQLPSSRAGVDVEAHTTGVDGPLGNIRAERTGGGARIFEVARVTGQLHLWPVEVCLAASERLLAVTTSLDGSTAWLAVSDERETHVVRVRERDGVKRYAVDGVGAARRARFGGHGERDVLVLETASGAEQQVRVRTLLTRWGTGTPA